MFIFYLQITLSRVSGIFGETRVTWQISPRDLDAFVQRQGQITFGDRQREAIIVLQVFSIRLYHFYHKLNLLTFCRVLTATILIKKY